MNRFIKEIKGIWKTVWECCFNWPLFPNDTQSSDTQGQPSLSEPQQEEIPPAIPRMTLREVEDSWKLKLTPEQKYSRFPPPHKEDFEGPFAALLNNPIADRPTKEQIKRTRVMKFIPMYYFGCYRERKLQQLFVAGMHLVPDLQSPQFPFSWDMLYDDLCHTEKRDVGETTLIQVYGWTILSFWDNTTSPTFVPNVSSFIAPGFHSAMGMLDLVVKHFPEVYRRVLPILKIRHSGDVLTEKEKLL